MPRGSESVAAHRADIQGLRAIAVLLVAAYHSDIGVGGGFLGVDVFFVISGFVICGSLSREAAEHGRIGLGAFYLRRARRLLPALAVFVPAVVVLSVLTLNPHDSQPFALRTALSAQAFVANLFLYRHVGYFDSSADRNPFLHMWSLSIEEQFYVVFPVVLLAGVVIARRWRRVGPAVLVGIVGVCSFVLSLALTEEWVTFGSVPARLAYFAMPTRAWEFCAGALVALAMASRRPPRWWSAVLGTGGLVAVVVGVVVAHPEAPYSVAVSLPVALGTAAMMAAPEGWVARVLSQRPLTYLGDTSYAWYLWHWPAIVIAAALWPDAGWLAPVAAVVALAPAAASTRWVEAPLRHTPMTRAAAMRLVGVCVVVPLIVSWSGARGADSGWGVRVPDDWYDLPAARMAGCNLFNRDLANTWPEDSCTWSAPGAQDSVLVLGDLQADAVSPAVVAAAGRLGLTASVWTRSECPLSARTPVRYPRCADWNDAALDLIDRLRPAVVVIGNDSADYVDLGSGTTVAGDDGAVPATRDDALAVWRAGLDELLTELDERGVAVIVVASVPDYGSAFPRARASVVRPAIDVPTLARAEVEASRKALLRTERDVVDAHPGAQLLDPLPLLCDDRTCTPVGDGRWWYYEPKYLNRLGALRLAPAMEAALERAIPSGT